MTGLNAAIDKTDVIWKNNVDFFQVRQFGGSMQNWTMHPCRGEWGS